MCCFDINYRLEKLVKTLQVNATHPPSSTANENQHPQQPHQHQQQQQQLTIGDGVNNTKIITPANSLQLGYDFKSIKETNILFNFL